MIVTMTDFGVAGPYLGQMRAAIAAVAPETPVIDLFADAPAFDPQASAYLLAAYAAAPVFAPDSVFLAVIDPGVGSSRAPVVVRARDRWFVGPDNGLFTLVLRRAPVAGPGGGPGGGAAWRIDTSGLRLSASFHGRDLFAPVAARLSRGDMTGLIPIDAGALAQPGWPDDLARIVYCDGYGNAMTGLRAEALASPGGGAAGALQVGGHTVPPAHTFADVAPGAPLWYVNANGLIEIAVNQGSAADRLGARVGTPVAWAPVDWAPA